MHSVLRSPLRCVALYRFSYVREYYTFDKWTTFTTDLVVKLVVTVFFFSVYFMSVICWVRVYTFRYSGVKPTPRHTLHIDKHVSPAFLHVPSCSSVHRSLYSRKILILRFLVAPVLTMFVLALSRWSFFSSHEWLQTVDFPGMPALGNKCGENVVRQQPRSVQVLLTGLDCRTRNSRRHRNARSDSIFY